ncbi:substrate-binding domain-containing protein [Methyloferula stellata]|uniref:substrate-binding domain-containing protein n=1 Tax=Methyloferula stellata TaxID=876270 RepID=UPI00037C2EE9|nr:substrate-binding domain-containing protein [Methyloferula stellata]
MTRRLNENLRSGTSVLAISAVALIGASVLQPAFAQTAVDGIFGGGSTLASVSARNIFDCYGTPINGGTLPTGCPGNNVEGLYAGVGSGSGVRGFISNDPSQLFNGSGSLPAVPPNYIDSVLTSNTPVLSSYPYPHVDFGAGDSPLPSNFTSGYTTTTYVVNWSGVSTAAGSASYPATNFGAPIQLPLFEAPVAVAVNVPAVPATGWTINSQNTSNPASAGGAIQLSAAQICAIFSGLVTDWNSNPSIPAGASGATTPFDSTNTPGTPMSYSSSTTPIKVVYRSDGSGTSFIFTNYLSTVCPQIDATNVMYAAIFSPTITTGSPAYTSYSTYATNWPLPSTGFSNLLSRINAYRTANSTATISNWIGTSGSGNVAAAIGNAANQPSQIGNIGYLSNDFVQPYNTVTTTAPLGASVQNEYQIANGITQPSSANPPTFIPPTPTSADAAWSSAFSGVTPSTAWTYADYNVYAKTDSNGRSLLPLASASGAYPLTGTTFLYLYSCYGSANDGNGGSTPASTRYTDLVNDGRGNGFLNWYYDASGTSPAADVITASGFNPLSSAWLTNINSEYVDTTNLNVNSIDYVGSGNGTGCVTGATGAN